MSVAHSKPTVNTVKIPWTIDDFHYSMKKQDILSISEEQEKHLVDTLTGLHSTRQLVEFWKYPFQEHTVVTRDGYHLGTHRIPHSRDDQDVSSFRPPVLLWHGLCISSEAFVCHVNPSFNLAMVLSDAGFDVWMGNSRGNTYSQNHQHVSPNDKAFWRFSIDELAEYDLPDTVDYILNICFGPKDQVKYHRGPEIARPIYERKLAYIGYSQGSAMGFSALSRNKELNDKLNVFIALAPAMRPKPIKNKLITTTLNYTSPNILYPILGHFSFLPIASKVAKHYPDYFHPIVDGAFKHLFGWHCDKFGPRYRKKTLYSHLFSASSHWFQIIAHDFRPYHATESRWPLKSSTPTADTLPPKHPTELITTKMHLFHGSDDNISDIHYLMDHLDHSITHFHELQEYNHMDFLWAVDAKDKLWNRMIDILQQHTPMVDRRDRRALFSALLEAA